MCHSRLASIGLCHLKKYRNGNYHSRSRHGSYTHAKPVTEQEKRASRGQKSHRLKFSRILRKEVFCTCEIRGAYRLCSSCAADWRLLFRYIRMVCIHDCKNYSFWEYAGRYVPNLLGNQWMSGAPPIGA